MSGHMRYDQIKRLQTYNTHAHKEINRLIGEVSRLKGENEMLRKATDADGFHRVLAIRDAEIAHLRLRLNEVDAQLTAESHIHARECIALRAEKDAEIEQLKSITKGLLLEWDKLTKYGSPIAKAANERITAARAKLEQ
jgi:hypothetical protein